MSDYHFIAVMTYGKEKHGDKSYFKLGRGAGGDVLLALFDNRARELAAPRASYRYLYLDDSNAVTHRNYLVLRLTTDEKAQVETICRKVGSHAWVYLWESEGRRWLEFPCAPQAHYIDPTSYGGAHPKFPPTAAKFITPSRQADEKTASVPSAGVTLTQSGDWWWIAGDTYPHRETIKQAGAKWSKSRREWYFKGHDLPQAIRDLTKATETPAESTAIEVVTTPVEESSIIVTVSSVSVESAKPDNVQYAIQRMKEAPAVVKSTISIQPGIAPIAQAYVGELTGSITGNVHCYGYAVDQGVCVYLNFGGPRTAVEAIRAKFSKGEAINCVPWNDAAIELTPGEGNTGKYRDFMQNISEARYTSVVLLHEQITAPNYGGKSRTCILRTDEAQGVAMLKHHVTQLVTIPVFDAWADYLWDAGALACLVSRPIRAGGIDLWAVELDGDAWTRLICGGLEQGLIRLPIDVQ
ncbi:MAG: hypothetical protein ABI947_22985 [Chloroflexota bacterium]